MSERHGSSDTSTLTLDGLRSRGVLSALAYTATRSVMRLSGERDERVGVALALAQMAISLGHLGLRLEHVRTDFSPEVLRELMERRAAEADDDALTLNEHIHPSAHATYEVNWSALPRVDRWCDLLAQSPAVWAPDRDHSGERELRARARPFVLEGSTLFTFKAWRGEDRVARALRSILAGEVGPIPHPELLWSRLFAEDDRGWFDGPPCWDRARLALYTALRSPLAVIHGGPGTGKTTLTQRVLAALIEQYGTSDKPLRIAVAAPTGKAAQRLTESIRARASFFQLPDVIQEQLETLRGVTLHSLIGVAPGRRPSYHSAIPLPYDVIVVDECSMVDLWLLQSLLDAIDRAHEGRERRRLLLVGDPHQLPSVSAGAPLTELCGDRGSRSSAQYIEGARAFLGSFLGSSPDSSSLSFPMREGARDSAGLIDCVVALNQVRRVSAESGIHAAATAIQEVEQRGAGAVLQSFTDPRYLDTELIEAPPLPTRVLDEMVNHAQRAVALAKHEPAQALTHLKELCLLSPHYGGPLGVNELNDTVEERLRALRVGGWGRGYAGRPVLITQNHPPTGLVNGDIGVIGPNQWVYFEGHEEPIKLSLLPPHRTVFAMSIHKSQGSEFKRVMMFIPPERSPIMTRELIYTGLTRAKKSAVIIGAPQTLARAVEARVERGGRLSERLTRL